MDTLNLGDNVNYIYDFGSSTELITEVPKYSNYQLSDEEKVELVARNYLPLSNCAKCGHQATQICTACENEKGLFFVCDKCAGKYHNEEDEEEHYLLPMANSPRAGVCGYGSTEPIDKLF